MNEHTHTDPLAELAALRQRLDKLEAEHRDLQRKALHPRRPVISRKFLLSVLPVATLLAAAGVLLAVDAMFVDTNGNVGIGNNSPTQKLDVTGNAKISGKLDVGGDVTVAGSLSLPNGNKMFALSGEEQLRILRGNVSDSGDVEAGKGFDVTHVSESGRFNIDFKPFKDKPSVWIMPFDDALQTGDKVSVFVSSSESMIVTTANVNGRATDRGFTFVIVGPEKQGK